MPEANPIVRKVAVRFAKAGRARFLSHHDILRFCERAVRRAGLPVRCTEGFNPRPRIVFLHPLGLGIAAHCEEMEIELVRALAPAEVLAGLQAAMRPVLDPLTATVIPPQRRPRRVVASTYRTFGWPDAARLAAAAGDLMGRSEARLRRERDGEVREVDVRAAIAEARPEDRTLWLRLLHRAEGGGRVEDVIRWLSDGAGADVGAIECEKTAMEVAWA